MGWQKYVKKLSEIMSGQAVPNPPSFSWSGKNCLTLMGRAMAQCVPGADVLIIGPQSCLNNIGRTRRFLVKKAQRIGAFRWERPVNYRTLVTSTEGCAMGDDSKIAQAIREVALKDKPSLLFVTTTCAAEVLGVDIPGILKEVGDVGGTRVFFVQGDNVSTREEENMEEDVLTALHRIMKKPAQRDRSLNLLGAWFPHTIGEYGRVLEAAGAKPVNAVPSLATPESIENAPSASWNIVVSGSGEGLARAMKERFGCDYLLAPVAVGSEGNRQWYGNVAAYTGLPIDVSRLFDETEAMEKRLSEKVKGVSFALGHLHLGEPVQIGRYLADMGMIPQILVCDSVSRDMRGHAEALLAAGHDPYVIRPEKWALRFLFAENKPDIVIGFGTSAREAGIPNVPMVDGGLPGFEGTQVFLEFMEATAAKWS